MDVFEAKKGLFEITTDFEKMDLQMIHQYLSKDAYWCLNIPFEIVERSVKDSLSFGLFYDGVQIGFARVITDRATIAYFADVFILPSYRGREFSKWLIEVVHSHPDLQGLRRSILLTSNAHGLYEEFGWEPIKNPEIWMGKVKKQPY